MRIRDWFRRRGGDAYTLDDGLPADVEFRAIRCPHDQPVRLTLDYEDVEPADDLARQAQARIDMATQIADEFVAGLDAAQEETRVRGRSAPSRTKHACGDYCRDYEQQRIIRRRDAFGPDVSPGDRRLVPFGVKHRCGTHCTPRDPETPVRLGRGRPDPYDRTPVRCGCGGWMRPGQRHYCRGVA